MSRQTLSQVLPDTAKVEISGDLLAKLIVSGLLPGSECKCLDANAKQVIWQSLLSSSVAQNSAV